MKHEIIRSLNPFNSFLHVFRKKKGHNILGLMLDPKFKFRLVSNNLRCDRVAILVTQYDELLLFPLLVESYKLLRHNIVVEELINCKAWSAQNMMTSFTPWRKMPTISSKLFQKNLMDSNTILSMEILASINSHGGAQRSINYYVGKTNVQHSNHPN